MMKRICVGWSEIGRKRALLLIIGGLVAGFINGLLGAGGGIVIVLLIGKLFFDLISEKNDVFANALCVMLPLSVLSCALYYMSGRLELEGFGPFIAPAIIGGAVGGVLQGRLRAVVLQRAFAALVVISGILMVVR